MLQKTIHSVIPALVKLKTRYTFLFDQNPILIYQMGKVGSSTVYHSLKEQVTNRSIYHFHSINRTTIEGHKTNNRRFIKSGDFKKVFTGVGFGELMNKRILEGNEKFDVITLVREPLTRNISAFFQNAYRWIPDFEKKCLEGTLDTRATINYFFSKGKFHTRGLDWVEMEIKGVLGIDVYASSFPVQKGYEEYENKKSRLLLLRMEDLNDKGDVIKGFLGLDNFKLKNANVGGTKFYSDAYKAFKKSIRFPEEYIDRLHSHKYSQHFYNKSELDKVKEEWIK